MGNWGRVNIGSGGGKLFAIIAVTYPAGSVCTCTNGTRTLNAKDTSGKVLFNVPSAGTWVVSCTNGTKTASKSVSITAEGQTEKVTLAYEYVLYEAGTKYVDFKEYNYSGSISWDSDSVTLTGDTTGFGTTSTVDVTDYSTLNISAIYAAGYGETHLGLSSSLAINYYPYAVADLSLKFVQEKTTQSLDISNISGSYYVCLCKHLLTATAYKIWLE